MVVALGLRSEALLDRVLMAARKGGEHQIAGIGRARVDRDIGAIVHRVDDLIDIREVEFWINALGIHVECDCNEIAIAGAFAIAEQASLHAVGTGHQTEFGGRDTGAAIVMGVQRNHHAVAVRDVRCEPFDLVGIDIGRSAFDRGGQVEDDRLVRRRLQDVHHCGADFDREIEFGGGEGFRTVFERPVGFGLCGGTIAQNLGTLYGDSANFVAGHAEDDLAPCRADRIVEMDDGARCALQALEALFDQVAARLGEHLNVHVVGNAAIPHEPGDEIEFGRARAGKTDLDFLQTDLAQQIEHPCLLFRIHRIDQRLIAVAQIGRKPARRTRDRLRRPLAVRQLDLGKRAVFHGRVTQHRVSRRTSGRRSGRFCPLGGSRAAREHTASVRA